MRSPRTAAAILAGASVLLLARPAVPADSGADAPAGAAAAGGAEDLLRRIAAHLGGDRDEVRRYSYVESAVLEKRGPDGGLRSRSIEVYEIFPRKGQLMRRALSIDPGQDSEGSAAVRREESRFLPQARTVGTGGEKPVKESPFDVERLVRCFRFESQGAEAVGGKEALKVRFTPVEGCLDDGSHAGRLLQNLSGSLWIDAGDQDVLRIEGRIGRPVTFGFGLLGRVDDFALRVDREAVAPGLYTMTHMDYRARGAAFLFHRFDITSIRDRSAFARLGDPHPAAPPDTARHDPRPPSPEPP